MKTHAMPHGRSACFLAGVLLAWISGPATPCTAAATSVIGPAGIPLVRGSYGIYELGALGGASSSANDINNDGVVTGSATDSAGNNYGFVWENGLIKRLDALPGGKFSEARAISSFGASAGTADESVKAPGGESHMERRAVRWQNGAPVAFGIPDGADGPEVYGITAGGSLVGSVGTTVTNMDGSKLQVVRAVRWLGGRGNFLTSDERAFGRAFGVSAGGTFVVGFYRPPTAAVSHAVVFNAGATLDIHTRTDHPSSVALAANDAGVVVGYTYKSLLPTFYEPFIWTAARGMRRPPLPDSAPFGQVMDVSERGVAVGVIREAGVMLWLNAGETNELGFSVQDLLPQTAPVVNGPVTVNDYGEIAAVRVAGTTHAVLLYPTNRWRQVSGTIRTTATESSTNIVGAFPAFTYPLRAAPVELLSVHGGLLAPVARQITDDNGHYAFLFRIMDDTQFALKVTLSDDTGWVDVFDGSTDTNAPAWLRTPSFPVNGDTQSDVDMVINANPNDANPNKIDYKLNGVSFALGPTNAPASDAASNSSNDDFAHLTVFYRNIRLAAQFATERLKLTMPRLPLFAFEPRGSFDPLQEHIQRTGVPNEYIHTTLFDDAASYFDPSHPSVHFPQISSSFNQPTLGLPGNPMGYTAIRIRTNTVTRATSNESMVGGRDRPDNREFHEYSHYIMYHSTIGGVDAVPHRATNEFGQEIDGNHLGYANTTSTDSWTEGFAEFGSCVISDVMLDRSEKLYPDAYFTQGAAYRLENNSEYTNFLSRFPEDEELTLASILWDLHDPIRPKDHDGLEMPINDWWGVMNASASGPGLLDFKAVYDAFADFATRFPLRLDPDAWADRCVRAALFDDRTFTDTRRNGVFDLGETLGMTSWNPLYRHRRNLSVSTWLTLNVQLADGSSASNVVYGLEIQYDPPLDDLNFSWQFPTYGPASVALPFILPPHPCQVVVTPHANGVGRIPAFSFTSGEVEAVLASRTPGDDGQLMAHLFIAPPPPKLEIALVSGGTRLEFSWPADDPPFVLEFTRSLAPPVSWAITPGSATKVGNRMKQQFPLPDGAVFLRIRQR